MIIHVIPDAWGPFVDIRACLRSLARRRSATHVITPREFTDRVDTLTWRDPNVLFICWDLIDPGPREGRRCKIAYVYSEAIDRDRRKLLPSHLDHWKRFYDLAPVYDAVFAHTPLTASILRGMGWGTFLMPVGWDAEAMGAPRWDAAKHNAFEYHGSFTGRREILIPHLSRKLGSEFIDASGCYGRDLLGKLDTSRISLYIAHSLVESFSTWRLWQTVSTSAVLVGESSGDTWPFDAYAHYIPIDYIDIENADHVIDELHTLAKQHDRLNVIANAAHQLAQAYTVDRVEDEFVIPAHEELKRW